MPGAMTFRCVHCGATFKYEKDEVFLCGSFRKETNRRLEGTADR